MPWVGTGFSRNDWQSRWYRKDLEGGGEEREGGRREGERERERGGEIGGGRKGGREGKREKERGRGRGKVIVKSREEEEEVPSFIVLA